LKANETMTTLHILSGGAAFGLVSQLEGRFGADTDCRIAGTYNAVGAMRDALLAGAPCDVAILTSGLIAQLEASGHVVAGSARDLGRVKTGIAVPQTASPTPTSPALDVSTPDALKAALLSATGIYFPDPVKATAGIHFMSVLKQLGIDGTVAARLRPYPNGATAMAEMAKAAERGEGGEGGKNGGEGGEGGGLIGCTQMTEIMYTAGVQWVAPLPQVFELATLYTAAVTTASQSPNAAGALVALLSSPHTAAVRHAGGFDN
jgi:molybdate transport system substrate-binding protein